jgi:transcriptional regulator with XRE-family HTH domain
MTAYPNQSQTTSATAGTISPPEVKLATGLLVDADFGTTAGVLTPKRFGPIGFEVTRIPAAHPPVDDPSAHVRALRERILECGLSKQEIARAIGVDRRSLSGYAKGQIRPSSERLQLLRTLTELCEDIALERPGRVRGVLLSRRGQAALIDQVSISGRAILTTWRTWVTRSDAVVTVTQRRVEGQPLWAAAARALAEGRIHAPTRAHTVRPESTYEMDLAEAGVFAEPEYRSRRRNYR